MRRAKLTEKQKFWQAHIEAQTRSDLSRRQYCEQHSLDAQQMCYFAAYLKKKGEATKGFDTFIKLRAPAASPSHVTIRFADGVSVECPVDAKLVSEVLRSLH